MKTQTEQTTDLDQLKGKLGHIIKKQLIPKPYNPSRK